MDLGSNHYCLLLDLQNNEPMFTGYSTISWVENPDHTHNQSSESNRATCFWTSRQWNKAGTGTESILQAVHFLNSSPHNFELQALSVAQLIYQVECLFRRTNIVKVTTSISAFYVVVVMLIEISSLVAFCSLHVSQLRVLYHIPREQCLRRAWKSAAFRQKKEVKTNKKR